MKIGIFANVCLFEKAGIGQYARSLIREILRLDKRNQYILYFSFIRHRRERMQEIKDIFGGRLPANLSLRILSVPAAWFDFLSMTPLAIKSVLKDDLDLYFSPYAAGIPKNGFKNMVFTCHDLVFLKYPQHRGKKLSNYYLKRNRIAVNSCQKIIVPSLATRKDVREYFNLPLNKLVLIPEASGKEFHPIKDKKLIEEVIAKYFDPKIKYILSVGTLEPRKNLSKLVEAFALLPNEIKRNYRLVLVGAKGWNNDVLERTINNLNLRNKVIQTGFARASDLPYIYNGASVFIYPSLYEGFGLPPLEAISCGIPTIVSKTSSLPEVVGSSAILVNPKDEKEIAESIKKVLSNPDLSQKMVEKGFMQAKRYSWAKAAKQTLQLFQSFKAKK